MAESKKLTSKQLRGIAAMLTEPSHEAAAKNARVHVKTLKLWRRNPAIQKLPRAARKFRDSLIRAILFERQRGTPTRYTGGN